MKIKYICTHWGQEQKTATEFIHRVLDAGYDGIEINMPADPAFVASFLELIAELKERRPFLFVAQQVLPLLRETPEAYKVRMVTRLQELVSFHPDFINTHTGKDHFSFDDNCRIIEAAMNTAGRAGVRLVHETHRGRFTWHAASLLPYLERFPQLELAGDLSHWCAVSESLLEDQQELLNRIMPHITHIHARIGHEQGPQVNDPRAPEWHKHLETFINWWKQIAGMRSASGAEELTVCPEFGPAPYMPALPFTGRPLADQWEVNLFMKQLLRERLG